MGRFDILKQDDSQNRELEVYSSDFNFSEYEMEDMDTIRRVTETEEEIIRTAKQIAKKNLEMGKLLYETQQLMANYKNGTFVAWFTYMGLDKNFVYREINRWELFRKLRNPQVAEASVRTLDFIKKHEELEEDKITEILEDPKQAPEKIKSIVEEKISDSEETGTEDEITKIDEKIKKLELQLEKLKEKKIKLQTK
jgi:hypothetical protein